MNLNVQRTITGTEVYRAINKFARKNPALARTAAEDPQLHLPLDLTNRAATTLIERGKMTELGTLVKLFEGALRFSENAPHGAKRTYKDTRRIIAQGFKILLG